MGEPGGSPQAGRGGSVTGSRAHLPKARRCGRAGGLLCARRAELWIVTRRRWKRPSRVNASPGPKPGREELGESLAGAGLGEVRSPRRGQPESFSAPKALRISTWRKWKSFSSAGNGGSKRGACSLRLVAFREGAGSPVGVRFDGQKSTPKVFLLLGVGI